jgi:hypothetical protein
MDMKMSTARMIVIQRADLGQPKRQQECSDENEDKASEPDCLFSYDLHVVHTSPARAVVFFLLTKLISPSDVGR